MRRVIRPIGLLIIPALALTAACGAKEEAKPAKAVSFNEEAWQPKTEADIPNDSLGASIKRGLYLLRFTPESLPKYATSSLRCTSCHQNDGLKKTAAPLTGAHSRFPKYMPRSGAVIALDDRVNYCFTRSLAGNAIPVGSREMTDILSYLAFISYDVPVGTKIAGTEGIISMKDTLVGDIARGEQLYAQKTCVTCHGPEGKGAGAIPSLWGATSYSIGASMAREERAASFIMHNMPQTAPGTLTPQEAFDLAAFINSHPRPDSPGKELDWPLGGAPADVPYDTKGGHKAHRPPASLVTRANPSGALVPNPPRIGPSK
ncbi:MAG: c-type cytochrome [Gammaproteobacteria bacterium]|nr:c-type cytochrome [Gammaproteobacteria bacterium]